MSITPETTLRQKAEQIIQARRALSDPLWLNGTADAAPFKVDLLSFSEFDTKVIDYVQRKTGL